MSFRATVVAVCVALCCATLAAGDYQLPKTVKTCNKDSSDFSSCLRLAIQESWPTFVQGIPELDLPALDPFYLDQHTSEFGNGELRGKVTAKDVQTYGLAKARFLSVKPEMSGDFFRLEIDLEIPKVLCEGDYKAEGSLGSFRVGGKGFFNVSMEDLRITWDITGHVVNDRWVVEHFNIAPNVGSMKIWFSDLFNGNDELNRAALVFANEYWPIIYRGMMPQMLQIWDSHFTEFVNRFFSKIPFSTLFP
ncbi:circadian clock-controlled protein daywake [Calliopsis andreniformis]|uniref:circadian clock-controlled protein daywake n=1 Tax=Calliopsis andreniformis TaxID=337506 RepID=UPI003FCE1E29